MPDDPMPNPIPAHLLSLPMRLKLSLWLALGTALGLPIDAVLGIIDGQLIAARRQLAGKRLRLTDGERRQQADWASVIGHPFRDLVHWLISPDSLTRWLKRDQARRANHGAPRTVAKRPWIGQEKVDAILRVYDAGCTGLSRIVGEMTKCGLAVAESTVRRVLTAHGRSPTPRNGRHGSTRTQFWNRHADQLVGIDFLQIPVGWFTKAVNAFVFCAIEHDTRRVHLLGITINPTDAWISNTLRAATMDGAPLERRRFWILDNDGKYGAKTTAVLGDRAIWTSIHAPDMNAFIERWNRSAREECLDHIVFRSEDALRHAITVYIDHYNSERPHQGIGNVPIGPWQTGPGEIVCDERLHGLLKSFRRAA